MVISRDSFARVPVSFSSFSGPKNRKALIHVEGHTKDRYS